jgi:hypothetical protein
MQVGEEEHVVRSHGIVQKPAQKPTHPMSRLERTDLLKCYSGGIV